LRSILATFCLTVPAFRIAAFRERQDAAPVSVPSAATPANANPTMSTPPTAASAERIVLKSGTEVSLVFATDLNSKTAVDDDTVNMTLAEDLKVGDVIVVKKGALALATVTNAKKAGMMGKAGELSIRLEYLRSDDQRLRLRGSKGRKGRKGRQGWRHRSVDSPLRLDQSDQAPKKRGHPARHASDGIC
jgi:hypothetical protein